MLPSNQQKELRAMLERKREMDKAWEDYHRAREEYRKAQTTFLGHFPQSSPPGPFIVGTTFIAIKECEWTRADCEIKFDYTEAERCPTSD